MEIRVDDGPYTDVPGPKWDLSGMITAIPSGSTKTVLEISVINTNGNWELDKGQYNGCYQQDTGLHPLRQMMGYLEPTTPKTPSYQGIDGPKAQEAQPQSGRCAHSSASAEFCFSDWYPS